MTSEELLAPLESFGIRPGLETIRALLAEMGEPQRRLRAVLVAGTNGKGSTCCLLAAVAARAGFAVGLYTSPHLERVRERVRIDGASRPDAELVAELRRVLAAARAIGRPVTYFEALTAAALARFAAHGVELAVLEVGMGGRLDATNAVEPELSLICEIAHDHEVHLGRSVAEIAGEKAGILRSGRPGLFATSSTQARRALEAAARRHGARLAKAADRVRVREVTPPGPAAQVEVVVAGARHRLRLPLAGRHQLANLGLAVAGALELERLGFAGIAAPESLAAIESCRWPGRLEQVAIGGGRTVLLDTAHNPSGAAALADHLERLGLSYRLLFGALATKAAPKMLAPLAAGAGELFFTEPPGPEAWPAAELARLAGRPAATVESRPARALEAALAAGTDTLVVCGSIYLVGAVRAELRRRFGIPAPATDPLWPPLSRRR
ncbi:MAG: Mur ligase family protein [Thermoanaerobaculia bacterium]|nr:Mur ligase family protein [Thermoanaerobaculia bacterium]